MRHETFKDQFVKGFKEAKNFRKKTILGSRIDWEKWYEKASDMPMPYFLGHMVGDIALDFDPKQISGIDHFEVTLDKDGKPIPK